MTRSIVVDSENNQKKRRNAKFTSLSLSWCNVQWLNLEFSTCFFYNSSLQFFFLFWQLLTLCVLCVFVNAQECKQFRREENSKFLCEAQMWIDRSWICPSWSGPLFLKSFFSLVFNFDRFRSISTFILWFLCVVCWSDRCWSTFEPVFVGCFGCVWRTYCWVLICVVISFHFRLHTFVVLTIGKNERKGFSQ